MAAKLVWSVYEDGAVAWHEDGEEGAIVGESPARGLSERLDAARKKVSAGVAGARADVEWLTVELAAQRWLAAQADRSDIASGKLGGIRISDGPLAANYMKTLKMALRHAHDATPWPEWALRAQAAGWKPPKGWKP